MFKDTAFPILFIIFAKCQLFTFLLGVIWAIALAICSRV